MLGEFISRDRCAALVARARCEPQPWLDLRPDLLDSSYNRLPYPVEHRLAEHPLFALDPLFALCRRLPEVQVKHRFGVVPDGTHFDSSLDRYRGNLTLEDAITHLEERQAYIAIYNAERDPEYQPVIEGLLGEVAAWTEALDPAINWYSTYTFISAHDSVTPYHMDREMNFLFQIRGTKTVQLWDPFDDDVMSAAQKDLLFASADACRPPYREALQSKAMAFELQPGMGVHHPFIAPHLVHTGPAVSITFALTFRTPQSDVWSDAHRFNHRLRRLGLHPGPVRHNALIDRTKAGLERAGERALRALRPRRRVAQSDALT
ncbi:hypothetical protein GCM10009105_08790 [Dokdonella soli]|uniref:JmjC domain-containing protein n=1 Tax=Dokdonella soli TaxID=529810 RepID=A0ABN1IDN2_9GAMM